MNALTHATPAQAPTIGAPGWSAPHVTEVAFTPYAATAATGTPARLWGIVQGVEGRRGLPWHGPVQAARLKAQEAHRAREAEAAAEEAANGLAELVSSVS